MNQSKIEQSVIGKMLMFEGLFYEYVNVLQVDAFIDAKCNAVYSAMAEIAKSHFPDALSIEQKLGTENAPEFGWGYFVMDLQNRVADANIEWMIAQLMENRQKRLVKSLAAKIDSIDINESLDSIMALLHREVDNVILNTSSKGDSVQTSLQRVYKQMQEKEQFGIMTPITKLNNVTGGYKQGHLIVYAGRPGMGKTAALVGDAIQACRKGKSVHIVSTEMTQDELLKRMIIQVSNIDSENVRSRQMSDSEWRAFNKAIGEIEKWDLTIDERNRKITDVVSRCKAENMKRNLDLILVDYIQRLEGTKQYREQEINEITQAMKNMAKDFKCPVVALAQLNRAVEQRTDKRPMLSDLRESGSIEQEGDVVMFFYRPEYYQVESWEDGTPTFNEAEIIIAKNRHGQTGKFKLSWDGSRMRYSDLGVQFY
jgi:replicative DNA helicase